MVFFITNLTKNWFKIANSFFFKYAYLMKRIITSFKIGQSFRNFIDFANNWTIDPSFHHSDGFSRKIIFGYPELDYLSNHLQQAFSHIWEYNMSIIYNIVFPYYNPTCRITLGLKPFIMYILQTLKRLYLKRVFYNLCNQTGNCMQIACVKLKVFSC